MRLNPMRLKNLTFFFFSCSITTLHWSLVVAIGSKKEIYGESMKKGGGEQNKNFSHSIHNHVRFSFRRPCLEILKVGRERSKIYIELVRLIHIICRIWKLHSPVYSFIMVLFLLRKNSWSDLLEYGN